MSNPTALSQLSQDFMEVDAEVKSPPKVKKAKKESVSGSDEATPSTRNELSEILSKIRFSKPTESATPSASSGSKSGSRTPSEVREANHLLSRIQRQTDRMSNNVLLYVKYLSSPLRLYLKTLLALMTPEDRMAHVATIKVADRVKEDLVSDWNNKDSFGLKILVKLYRMYTNVVPMFRDHEDFLRYLKPHYAKDSESRAHITYYLYNYVLNPGYALHPNGQVSLEHDLHAYIDSYLQDEKEEIAAVGFDIKDFRDQLRNKLAFELNLYMTVAFKKAVHFKHKPTPAAAYKEEKLQPEQLITSLYEKFSSTPVAVMFADQMMTWMMADDDMTAPARGYSGGKMKKSHKKMKRW